MFLSIIIPTYNRYDTLEICLTSIFRQIRSIDKVEVIIVDDCSMESISNKNKKLCSQFNFSYFRHDSNRGSATTRNTGIRRSVGKWVAFIDDDVTLQENWLEHVLQILPSLPKKIVGIEGCVEGSGEGLWDREVQNLHGGAYLTCNYLMRRTVLDQIGGFDTGFSGPYCEDHELTLRLLKIGEVKFEKKIAVTHLPRKIDFLQHIVKSPGRMKMVLQSEYYFYTKHPDTYHLFRHSHTFQGTFRSVLFRNVINQFRRRNIKQIFKNPFAAVVLFISGLIEQMTAWVLLTQFSPLKKETGMQQNSNQGNGTNR